jgi:hypothetical protein
MDECFACAFFIPIIFHPRYYQCMIFLISYPHFADKHHPDTDICCHLLRWVCFAILRRTLVVFSDDIDPRGLCAVSSSHQLLVHSLIIQIYREENKMMLSAHLRSHFLPKLANGRFIAVDRTYHITNLFSQPSKSSLGRRYPARYPLETVHIVSSS